MSAQALWPWIFTIGGWLLAAAGVALALWALCWDRSRGRRRCPKCWYEMAGVPGLRCPECGREASRESNLLRTRRRVRPALAGLAAVLAGHATVRTPDVRRYGWLEFAPTTLVAGLSSTSDLSGLGLMGVGGAGRATPKSFGEWWQHLRHDIAEVMRRRLRDERTWGWQARWYIRRVLRAQPPDVRSLVVLPARWPRGEPIPAFSGGLTRWEFACSLNGCMLDGSGRWLDDGVAKLPPIEKPVRSVRVRTGLSLRGVRVWDRSVECPIVIDGYGAGCLIHDRSDQTSREVRAALRPRLELTDSGEPRLKVCDRDHHPAWRGVDCGVYARLLVRVDGQVVGRGRTGTAWSWPVDRSVRTAVMEWEPGAHQRLSEPGARILINVEGNAEEAWIAYKDNPFDKPSATCWTGRFEVEGTLEELDGPR